MNETKRVCILCVQSYETSVLNCVQQQLASLQKKRETDSIFVYSFNNFDLTPLPELEIPTLQFSSAAGLHKAVNAINEKIPLSKRVVDVIWVSDGSIEAPEPDLPLKEQERSYDWWVALRRMLHVEKAVIQILATESQATRALDGWRQLLKIPHPVQVLHDVKCLGLNLNLAWRGRLLIQQSHSPHTDDKFSSTPASFPASVSANIPACIQLDNLHIRHSSMHSVDVCLWEYPHARILQTYRKSVVPPHMLTGETYLFGAPDGTPEQKFLRALQEAHQMCFIIGFSNSPPSINPFQPPEPEKLSYLSQNTDVSMNDHDWISYVARADDREIPLPRRYCRKPDLRPMLLVFGKRTQVIGVRLRDESHFSQLIDILEYLPCPFPPTSKKENALEGSPAVPMSCSPSPVQSKMARAKKRKSSVKRTLPYTLRSSKRRKLETKPSGVLETLASLPCLLSYKEICNEDKDFRNLLEKQIRGDFGEDIPKIEKGKTFASRFPEYNDGEEFAFDFDTFRLTYDELKAHLVRLKIKSIKEERQRVEIFCKLLPKPEKLVLKKNTPMPKKPPKPRKSTKKYRKRSKKMREQVECFDLKKYLQNCTLRIAPNPNEKKRSWREDVNDLLQGKNVDFPPPLPSQIGRREEILDQYVYRTPRIWQKHPKKILFPKPKVSKPRKPLLELDLVGWINKQVVKEDISPEEVRRKKSYLRGQISSHIEAKRQNFESLNEKERMQLYLTFSNLYAT